MKKLIAFSLVALFAGSLIAQNAPQANNTVAPKVAQDKDKDKKKHHHRHHREHREEKK